MAEKAYRKSYYSPTTSPNGKLAGSDGNGSPTGAQSTGFGMPERAGSYDAHYGQGAAGGARAKTPLTNQEVGMGKSGNQQKIMKEMAPINNAGTGADDYVQTMKPLKDSETEPAGPRATKPGKPLKFTSIAQLRDYGKKMTNAGSEAGDGGGVSGRRQYGGG